MNKKPHNNELGVFIHDYRGYPHCGKNFLVFPITRKEHMLYKIFWKIWEYASEQDRRTDLPNPESKT